MSTVVYRYGLQRPTDNAVLVEEQFRLSHRYANRLVEIERDRRVAVREVLSARDRALGPYVSEVEQVEAALTEAIDALRRQRASTRSRSDTAEQRSHVAALRDRKREVLSALKAERSASELDAASKARLADIEEVAHSAQRAARATCGVYWGTYLQIEAAMDAARKAPLWRCGEPSDPHFHHWDGSGAVAVQIQSTRPLTRDGLLACEDTRVQIAVEPLPDGQVSRTRERKRFATLRLRVGSEGPGNKMPIWASWPMRLHRPLPEGAVVTWAKVTRERIADRDRWELHLTLTLPGGAQRFGANSRTEAKGDGPVFINYGWRAKEDGGRRVAYWRDDCGGEGEILMDPAVLSGLRKVEDLRSIRDRAFNAARDALAAWLPTAAPPQRIREIVLRLPQWHSPARLAALLRVWREHRWTGDEEGFDALDEWERGAWIEELKRRDGGDRHLWRWEASQREKSLLRRKDHYRRIAADLARRYAVLVIEDFDLRQTQRRVAPESEDAEIAAARLAQKDAAISELRGCLMQAFIARGGRVEKTDAHLDTQRCALCGCEERWDASVQIDHTCEGCGVTWDQDRNATLNIERRFCERSNGDKEAPAKSLAKWAKRGRHNGTARKVEGNGAKGLAP